MANQQQAQNKGQQAQNRNEQQQDGRRDQKTRQDAPTEEKQPKKMRSEEDFSEAEVDSPRSY